MLQNLSTHQTTLMRENMGIDSQVTNEQLMSIKREQIEKGEPFLLENVTPYEEDKY